jgi:hypothetical protein
MQRPLDLAAAPAFPHTRDVYVSVSTPTTNRPPPPWFGLLGALFGEGVSLGYCRSMHPPAHRHPFRFPDHGRSGNDSWFLMTVPYQRPSLIDILRHIASGVAPMPGHAGSPAREAGEIAMKRELADLLRAIDPDDRASLENIRLPMLRKILLAEWGELALSDPSLQVMLRAADRLVAVDPKMQETLRRAVIALKSQQRIAET